MPAFDRNGSGDVSIDELIAAVGAALNGCPPARTATATATKGATATATRTVAPISIGVHITSPAALAILNHSPITVSGTLFGTGVQSSSPGFRRTSAAAPSPPTGSRLTEGQNILTAVATDATGQTVTDSISVGLDTTPPRVAIEAPADGSRVAEASLPVAGMVNDIVSGIVTAPRT